MTTKKLFILFLAVYCVVTGNCLHAMMASQLAEFRAEQRRRYQVHIIQQHQEMSEEELIEAEPRIIEAWQNDGEQDTLHRNLIHLPFHRKADFTDNFERGLREYSDLERQKSRFQRFCKFSTAATALGGLIPGVACFRKLGNLCHGRFKAVAAIVGGVSLTTYGVNKLAAWICNKVVNRNYNRKRNELESSINILKQKMMPETARYLRLRLERDNLTHGLISQSLLNRPFENDFELHGACRLLRDIQTRDS